MVSIQVVGRRSSDGPGVAAGWPSAPFAGAAAPERASARSADARRRTSGHHTAAAMIASTPQIARANCQPKAPASGPVTVSVIIEPMFIAAAYTPVSTAARCRKSRPITTGVTTFPTVIARPITRVPASAAATLPSDRTSVPTSSIEREISTARSTPVRAITPEASGAASPKHSTGRLVSRPTPVPDIPSAVLRSPVTVDTATSGPRRLNDSSTIPTRTRTGMAAAAARLLDGTSADGLDAEEDGERLHHQGVILGLRQAGDGHGAHHPDVPDDDRKGSTVRRVQQRVEAVADVHGPPGERQPAPHQVR